MTKHFELFLEMPSVSSSSSSSSSPSSSTENAAVTSTNNAAVAGASVASGCGWRNSFHDLLSVDTKFVLARVANCREAGVLLQLSALGNRLDYIQQKLIPVSQQMLVSCDSTMPLFVSERVSVFGCSFVVVIMIMFLFSIVAHPSLCSMPL